MKYIVTEPSITVFANHSLNSITDIFLDAYSTDSKMTEKQFNEYTQMISELEFAIVTDIVESQTTTTIEHTSERLNITDIITYKDYVNLFDYQNA